MSIPETTRETTRSDAAVRVVMLGTGTPRPDPDRSGPATAIIVNETPYLVDFGPGVVRRATAAYEKGLTAIGFGGVNIKTAFLTHMHADHTLGYPDLILTPWIMGRHEPLVVYGPKGLATMTEHVLKAWQLDIEIRAKGVDRRRSVGCRVVTHEITPGVVYRDHNVTVTAFPARHEDMIDSFSFRFETPDRVVVISGDTVPTQTLIEHSRGCDILVHEVYSMDSFHKVSPQWQEYRRRAHTSSAELAEIANAVNPQLLVLYHRSDAGGAGNVQEQGGIVVEEIRRTYKGNVVIGRDLDIF